MKKGKKTAIENEIFPTGFEGIINNNQYKSIYGHLLLMSLVLWFFRFAFSCIWEITPEAEIVSTKFHKSIIKSKVSE